MVFKKTACILLFSACPLIAPVEAEALNSWDWNKYYSDTTDTADTKSVISSGHTGQSITEGTYNGVTFGNAYYDKIDDAVENVKSSNNEGTINSGVITKQEVYGGRAVFDITSAQSKTVQANYNKITFKSGSTFETLNSDGLTNEDGGRYGIHGGHADLADITSYSWFYGGTGEAIGNEVVIEEGVTLKGPAAGQSEGWRTGKFIDITGGFLTGTKESSASNNKVKIYNPFIEGNVFVRGGGVYTISQEKSVSSSASENEVYFSCTTGNFAVNATVGRVNFSVESFLIEGAEAYTGTADRNIGTFLFGDNVVAGYIRGGYAVGYTFSMTAIGSASACSNELSVTGGKFTSVEAGTAISDKATANGNKAVLSDVVSDSVYGGQASTILAWSSDALDDNNAWHYPEGTVGIANNNTVVLNGGTYSGTVYGAMSLVNSIGTCEALNNRVELRNGRSGAPDFAGTAMLYGGYAQLLKLDEVKLLTEKAADGTSSGNSLNFYDVREMKAGNIGYFQILNYEYSEMHAGDVILTLNGTEDEKTTSIANAEVTVNANLYGSDGGDFKAGDKVVLLKNANGIDAEGITTNVTALKGATLLYDTVIETSEDKTELLLTSKGTKVRPGTKAIAEGTSSGVALAGEAANATMALLHDLSLVNGSVTPFVHVQGSSMRHETGSSINMSTVSLVAGLGYSFETGAGNLGVGAFFEYGKGSYTTSNSVDNSSDINGDGSSWYMGGGILAKMEFLQTGPGHFYLEGSAHMGTLHNEYDSNDLTDFYGNSTKFDMDSPYYSLHGGLGYVWNMAEGHDLDMYGKYIWTRVQGTDDTLTTQDKYEFDDMDSNRVRLGVRYSYKGSERFSPYVGAAFEHEFSGSCDSRVYGHSVAAPSFEGSSGMGELGLIMKPSEDLPLSVNLGVQGYVGQKQGISGSCLVRYEF